MIYALLFKAQGLTQIYQEAEFSELSNSTQHNALDDARVIKACYNKLVPE
jgi:inhibitor of KinA sporulation pathway (predicted exonuclease)